MIQSRNPARQRRRARQQRARERSAVIAAGLSVAAILIVGLGYFFIEANIPGTAVRNFLLLVITNGQVSPRSELYRALFAHIEMEDALIASPLSLLCGGLVLGRLIPSRFTRARLMRIATVVSVGVILAFMFFVWGLIIAGQHGHLRPGEVDTHKAWVQTACAFGWIAAYLVGAWCGVAWRDRRERAGAASLSGQSPSITPP
jgi:hypothetical protein